MNLKQSVQMQAGSYPIGLSGYRAIGAAYQRQTRSMSSEDSAVKHSEVLCEGRLDILDIYTSVPDSVPGPGAR